MTDHMSANPVTVALVTRKMELFGYVDLVCDKLTPYIRVEVPNDMEYVFERIPGVQRVKGTDNFVPLYRMVGTSATTNFRRAYVS